MGKGIKLVGSSLFVAIVAAIAGVLIFHAVQSALFSEVLKDTKIGDYASKYASITIYNITNEYVELSISGDEQICKLKERESCYSGCLKVTVSDIKSNSTDIDVTDEITCEVGSFAYNIGAAVRDAIGGIFGR